MNRTLVTTNVIYRRIIRVANVAGIEIDVHCLRRTFATLMENKRMPWSVIQKALGHNNMKTTQGYIMTDERKVVDWMRNYGPTQPEQPQPTLPVPSGANSLDYFQWLNDGF